MMIQISWMMIIQLSWMAYSSKLEIIQASWMAYSSKLDNDQNKLIEIIQVCWMMIIQLSFAYNGLCFNFAIQESAIIASDFWMT